jgi:hypothetical protein
VLALWGLLDRRLSRPRARLLLAAPLLYALAWFGMARWAEFSQHTFGGAAAAGRDRHLGLALRHLGQHADQLIRAHPWTGVGFGEFNLAWTLTPFPGRPTAFFDHTHNLPLQLLVELGCRWRRWCWAAAVGAGAQGLAGLAHATATRWHRRAALMLVLMIGLHSLLEYPLWYAYFLLPAAWAWGFGLGLPHRAAWQPCAAPGCRCWPLAGAAAGAGSGVLGLGLHRVVAIFAPPTAPAAGAAHRARPAQRVLRPPCRLRRGHHRDRSRGCASAPSPVPRTTCWTRA